MSKVGYCNSKLQKTDSWLAWKSRNMLVCIQKNGKVSFRGQLCLQTIGCHTKERILPFVITYHPAVSNLKQILMGQWGLIKNQPLLKTILFENYDNRELDKKIYGCSSEATTETSRGVRAGLSLTCSFVALENGVSSDETFA